MGNPKNNTGIKLIILCAVIIGFLLIGTLGFYGFKKIGNTNSTNSTINETIEPQINITNNYFVNETNVYQEKSGYLGWLDVIAIIGVFSIASFIVVIALKLLFNYLGKKPFSNNTKQKCVEAAVAYLAKTQHDIDPETKTPFYSYTYYEGGLSSNPRWAFGFPTSKYLTKLSVPAMGLITCIVNAKTLDVYNERTGRDWPNFYNTELREIRIGKYSRPDAAVAVEKEVIDFRDLLEGDNKGSINVPIGGHND